MNDRERQELEARAAGIKAAEDAATSRRKAESERARGRLALNDWPTPFRACPPRGLGQR